MQTLHHPALGWTPRLAEAFAAHAAEGLVPARVALEHTHIYRVFTEEGEWLARVSGRLRHRATARVDFPAVGDWVAIEPPAEGADARIRAVLPRTSRFSRRAAGDPTEEQIVAANIDTVFLVSGLDGDFNPRRIERYLVVAGDSGATPVIVLNKIDLVEDVAAVVEVVRAVAAGVDVHAVSCRRPESLDVLRHYLGHGQTGALLGSSGVGKSSIVNQLIGHELLRTREVRVVGQPRPSCEHRAPARDAARARRAHRHAGHARAAAVGLGRRGRRHVHGHRGARGRLPVS